jgi:histidyl-tRNA synthetase
MSNNIQSIRGMHDFAPEEAATMRMLENKLIAVLNSYAYREIRTPVVEKLDLFKRSIGEVTDIVEKEMYAFEDRGGEQLALRPEGTASTVRAGIQHGWLHNQQQRLWYIGPFFRRERPQKGRYRQFHQLGVEVYGIPGPDIDVELILLTRSMFKAVGLDTDKLELQINTLGDAEARNEHRRQLIEYLLDYENDLDDDARRRLHTNPLRILDSKNPEVQKIVENAPLIVDFLGDEAKQHFEQIQGMLSRLNVNFVVNPTLVRGLDYYNRTVFEWITHDLGAQGTICAGGRYDTLIEQVGGRPTAAIGFALGLERMHSLVEASLTEQKPCIDAYVVTLGQPAADKALELLEIIRSQLPEFAIQMNCGGGSIKAQMKRADKSGARLALILGEKEVEKREVTIKHLQTKDMQQVVKQDELIKLLKEI